MLNLSTGLKNDGGRNSSHQASFLIFLGCRLPASFPPFSLSFSHHDSPCFPSAPHQHHGVCQSQAGSRQCVPLAAKESQREKEEVETLALKCCPQPHPHPCFPSHALRGRRFGGVSGRAPTNRQSQPFPGGPGVRPPSCSICLCCSLCHPACQPSPAQQAGIPGCASPGPARGGSGLDSGVCEGFCYFVLFFCISSAFRALVFPSPEALTPSCASLWLSHPSLHLCHHLPEVSCQLWAQGASGPVNLSSCTHASHPIAEGWWPQHLEGLALCSGCPKSTISHPVPYPSFPSPQ